MISMLMRTLLLILLLVYMCVIGRGRVGVADAMKGLWIWLHCVTQGSYLTSGSETSAQLQFFFSRVKPEQEKKSVAVFTLFLRFTSSILSSVFHHRSQQTAQPHHTFAFFCWLHQRTVSTLHTTTLHPPDAHSNRRNPRSQKTIRMCF